MSAWAYVAVGWIGSALAIGGYASWLIAQRRRAQRVLGEQRAR